MTKGTFNEVQLHLFLMYALRYCVGQDSETISEYILALCLNWDAVPEVSRDALAKGLGDQIAFHNALIERQRQNGEDVNIDTNLGSPIDADSWIHFHKFVLRKQEENGKFYTNQR